MHIVNKQSKQGVIFAILAYFIWGIAPIYFKQLQMVSAFEILSHRVLWSVIVLVLIIAVMKQWSELKNVLLNSKRILILLITSILIGGNWLLYIWAVNAGHILEASLGYYINPLINVLFGRLFLAEKLRPLQQASVGLVVIGVAILLMGYGEFPYIALCLAFSFSLYGLLRKLVAVGPVAGLTVETLILLPIAGFYLAFFATHSTILENAFTLNVLLISAGIITTVPLLLFNGAAKRLRYSTIGFLQYIGPTLMFVIAVVLYDEVFDLEKAIIFLFVWLGVFLFSLDSLRHFKKQRKAKPVEV